jgi:multidrug resistance efflux pump
MLEHRWRLMGALEAELGVRDNEKVKKGQVLFRIDPDPYRLRVDQARAAVRGLEATLAVTSDQVASQTSRADAATSAIAAAEAQRTLATSTLARIQPLLGRSFVTAQQVDQALAAQRSAQVALEQARLQAAEAGKDVLHQMSGDLLYEEAYELGELRWTSGPSRRVRRGNGRRVNVLSRPNRCAPDRPWSPT